MTDTTLENPDMSWEQMRPLLDEAVGGLSDTERDAVVLRFFQDKNYREVGSILGLSEDAARMRVDRALDKLRAQFTRQGVTTTIALLAATLGAHGSESAPAGFAATVAGKTLASGAGAAGTASILAAKKGIFMAIAGAVAILLLIYIVSKRPATTPLADAPVVASKPVTAAATVSVTPPTAPAIVVAQVPRALPPPVVSAAIATAKVQSPPPSPAPPPPSLPPTDNGFASATAPTDAPPIPPAVDPASYNALVTANNRFALDLFQQFNPPSDVNAFFSPYSISTALAMTWAGAQGDTAAQMAKVLHFSELSGNTVLPSFTALQSAVVRAQTLSGAQLALANSLWPEQNPESPLRPEYLNLVQSSFASAITPVDFINHASDAAQQINAWVEDKTNGKIKDVIHTEDVDALTRLVLVNAIYFKGQWATAFQPNRDANSVFHTADGGAIPAVLMNLTLRTRYADITDGPVPCQVVALAYSSADREAGSPVPLGISFVAILPRAEGDLGALEKALTPEMLTGWLADMSNTTVQVILPKFKLEDRYQLADNLHAMGMADAFTGGKADFSGMDGTHNLYIAKVIHQTFLDVDENGTEAAAATAVIMAFGGAGGSRGAGPPPIFRADHPFLFMIRDDTTGSILFLGQLTHPAALQENIPAPPTATRRGPRATGARGTSTLRGPVFRGSAATATGSAMAPAASTASAPTQ